MAGNWSSVLNDVDTLCLHISVIESDASSRRGVEPCEQGWCSIHPYLATSMKFGTDVDPNILKKIDGAKAGGHWGRHNGKIEHARQSIFDFVITL